MTTNIRAQAIMHEFEDGAASWNSGSYSVPHGIAAVLRHIVGTDAEYGDKGSFYAVSAQTLDDLADMLSAPTLLELALAGDLTAGRQFLYQAGFTDEHGKLLPGYQRTAETTND
jgi:hypothetical protein